MGNKENENYKIPDVKNQCKPKDPENDPSNVFEMSPFWFNKYFTDRIYPDLINFSQNNLDEYSSLSKITKATDSLKLLNKAFIVLFCLSLLFRVFIVPLLFIGVYLAYLKHKRKSPFARRIKSMVFSHFNINILSNGGTFSFNIPSYNVVKKIFLLSSSNYEVDDFLLFTYKDLPIKMAEVAIFVKKGKHDIEIRHVLICTKINKKFKGETFLCSQNRDIPFGVTSNRQQVFLEDSVFNENFKIFSEDQIEARYLLTTSFMSRLLKYKLAHKSSLNIVFNNDISSASNVFLDIAIEGDKDFFEINSDPLSAKTYWDILQEIKELLKIVEALKLDQDIGM